MLRSLACLMGLFLGLFSASSRADTQPTPPIFLWGFQRGCDPLSDVTREVQGWLESTVTKPWSEVNVLSPDRSLLSCQGGECASLVERVCANVSGRIMGGTIEQNSTHNLTRMRLWMYDTQTKKTAYHDNYCQSCDLVNALKMNAAELAQHPDFSTPAASLPTYCTSEPTPEEQPMRGGKIFWVVHGKEFQKPAITGVVRKAVLQAGGEVQIPHIGLGKEYTLPVLKRIVARQPGSQVLVAEIQGNGLVELFMYDDATELTEVQRVECAGCTREDLLEKVRQTTMQLLSHCFGDSCARAGRGRAPAAACAPFIAPQCGDAQSLALLRNNAAASPEVLSPFTASASTAKLTKGAVWGLFTAGAVTTLALLAANYSSPGQFQGPGYMVTNRLLPGVGAAAGLTIVALGVAIPPTILIDRAAAPPKPAAKPIATNASGTPLLQCAN